MATGRAGEAYDAVVIGAGLGGLSVAASLAAMGRGVLVVERQPFAGGYAHAFRRGPYVFDPAVHFTGQAAPGQFLDTYLRLLGVHDRCPMIRLDDVYGVDFPGLRMPLPPGMREFSEAHEALFPHAAEGIRAFLALSARITEESQRLPPRLSLRDLEEAARAAPTLFRHRDATLHEVLDAHVSDPRAKAVLTAYWPYVGVPPSRQSIVDYGSTINGLRSGGSFYPRGGFQTLVDAFVTAIEQHGGELLLGTRVERIVLSEGRASGVVLADGRTVRTPAVVSNADARQTFGELVGEDHLPRPFVRRLHRLEPSLSAFVLYAATTADVSGTGLAHDTVVHRDWDHDRIAAEIAAGRPGGMWLSLPTIVDPSLAPPGEDLVIFSTLARYDLDWARERERFTEALTNEVEQLLPGFRDGLRHLETATPLTLEEYTSNQRGAAYGWDHIPSQMPPRRMAAETPVEGLYLAGHWASPGSGSFRVIYSGFLAAQAVLGYDSTPALLEGLGASAAAAAAGAAPFDEPS